MREHYIHKKIKNLGEGKPMKSFLIAAFFIASAMCAAIIYVSQLEIDDYDEQMIERSDAEYYRYSKDI